MTDQPRNWDHELAEIDKAIAKLPAQPVGQAPSPRTAGGPTPAVLPGAGPAVRRRDRVATWLWVLAGLALSVALPIWPYANSCGTGLFGYLGAMALLVLAAGLGMRAAWRGRQGKASVLALLMLLWGLALAALAVLPRIGYARASATWLCPATLPAPGPTAPASAPPAGATATPQGG